MMRFSCRPSSGKTRILNVLPSTHSKQRRVLHAVDDRLEDLAGVLPLGHAPFHEPAVDVHRQPRERGVGRQREIERALQAGRLVVEIGLVDRGPGKTVFDMHVDAVLPQAEPRFLPLRIDRHQAAAGIRLPGTSGEWAAAISSRIHSMACVARGAAEMSGGPAAGPSSVNCWPASTGSCRSLTCTLPWVTSSSVPAGATRTSNFVPRAIILPPGRADDEAGRGRVLRDLDVDLPAAKRHFPRGGERDGRIAVEIQDRAVGQGEPSPLVARRLCRPADLEHFGRQPHSVLPGDGSRAL